MNVSTAATCAVALFLAADPIAELAKLSDRALVEEYRSAGLALTGTRYAPWNRKYDSSPPSFPPDSRFVLARTEIVRRGKSVVSDLLDLLRAEATANRALDNNHKVSLADDVVQLLTTIGDPRAVPVLVEQIDGKKNNLEPYPALMAVEALTFCSMWSNKPHRNWSNTSVPHRSAINRDESNDVATVTRMYKDWLAGEGKDPANWLTIARRRANELLGGDDPDDIYWSGEFLFAHGDNQERVAARIAEVLNELKISGPHQATYRDKLSTLPIYSFARLLSRFGKLARPHARTLIRIQKEQPENASPFYAMLRDVGGDEVMAHLFGVLPRVSAEVAKIKADPNTPRGFSSDDPRGWWFDCLREIQLACDRWAGRRFDTDADRLAWWDANRRRSREGWLAENLELVVKQADAGDPWAGWVANEVLPDLPKPRPTINTKGVGQQDPTREPNYRTKWLTENRSKLKYDSKGEVFRLKVLPP